MLDVLYAACMLKRGIPASFVMLQFPGGVPGNSFALPDVDVVCSKETATGLPRFEKGQDRPSCKQWERKRLTTESISQNKNLVKQSETNKEILCVFSLKSYTYSFLSKKHKVKNTFRLFE